MLATLSIHDSDISAVIAAQETRAALRRIQEKMASQQKGEAFYDIGDTLEIPTFLRRRAKDGPDNSPMPQWILDKQAAARPASSNVGRPKHEPTAIELEVQAAADKEHEELTAGKRLAAKMLKEKVTEEKFLAHTRTKRKAEAEVEPAPVEAVDHSGDYWDTTSSKWRPNGYMSPAKYARLLTEMPTPAHRKAFIKMYGASQKPAHRDPAPVKAKPAKPAARKNPPAKAPRAAAALGERKLNPDHDAKVSAMLRRPEGATLPEIGAAMGWQNHSASAFLTGIRKTRTIAKASEERGTVYRLQEESK